MLSHEKKNNMEVRAQIKYVRVSPIKLRFLIDAIRDVSPQVALDHLSLSPNRTSKVLYKAIKSAVANGNAKPGFDATKAKFKTLAIDEGPSLRRFRAGPKGMARPYVRKSSHITVVIEQKDARPTKAPAKPKKAAPKKAEKKTEKKAPAKKAEAPKKKEVKKAEKPAKK